MAQRRFAFLLTFCLATACSDSGDNTPTAAEIDSDGDGFTLGQGDCNDSDPEVHPNGSIAFTSATNVNEKTNTGLTICRLPQDNDKLVREIIEVEVANNSCGQTFSIQSIILGPDLDAPDGLVRGSGPGPTTFGPAIIPPNTTAVVSVEDAFALDPRFLAPEPFPSGIAQRCNACGSSIFFDVSDCNAVQIAGNRVTCRMYRPRILEIEHSLGTDRIPVDGCLILYSCLPDSSRDPLCAG